MNAWKGRQTMPWISLRIAYRSHVEHFSPFVTYARFSFVHYPSYTPFDGYACFLAHHHPISSAGFLSI